MLRVALQVTEGWPEIWPPKHHVKADRVFGRPFYLPQLDGGGDMMFLTKTDIEQLTGRKRVVQQTQWLIENGYAFHVNAAGIPVVLRSVVEKRLGGNSKSRPQPKPRYERLRNGPEKA
jgi:hypothetical protein